MPIEGMKLVIEPSYPNAKEIAEIGAPKDDPCDLEGVVHRNTFYSTRSRCDVYVFEEPRAGGRVRHGLVPAFHSMRHIISTLGASDAWGVEQESKAVELLATLVSHRQMRHYLLTGMFLERSKRSGLTYLFRRLRPTVVINARGEDDGKQARIMCALCMHPIAYYSDSWAGAMCPTDDVVAHLMMMRGDEPMLWRRANQHAPHRPEAGL